MSFYNPSKNPFPFYNLEGGVWTNYKPKWHRNNCPNYQHVLNPGVRYFQLHLSTNVTSQSDITAINLRSVSDNSIVNANISRTIYSEGDNRILVMGAELTNAMATGHYYISISTAYGNYYSETFCVKPVNKEMTLIEWRSSSVIVGKMIYPIEVKQSINLNAKVILLEPQIEEETEENGFGEETAVLQKLTQPYFLSCVVPNYLGEALSAIQLHDQIIINNRLVGDEQTEFDYYTKVLSVKVVPEDNMCDSYVEITFARETIIKTTCEGQIIALNNAPFADIVWNDSRTTEDRECDVSTSCSVVMLSTELTMDLDGDQITLDWERNDNNGWVSIGTGETKMVTETTVGSYSYRLKATDTNGLFGYSNVLKYKLYSIRTGANLFRRIIVPSECLNEGMAYKFRLGGQVNTSVKFQIKVLINYGAGFTINIYDENMSSVFTQIPGSAGSTYTGYLDLDDGLVEYVIDLCLKPCVRAAFNNASIQFTLLEADEVTLSNQKFDVTKYFDCEIHQ